MDFNGWGGGRGGQDWDLGWGLGSMRLRFDLSLSALVSV